MGIVARRLPAGASLEEMAAKASIRDHALSESCPVPGAGRFFTRKEKFGDLRGFKLRVRWRWQYVGHSLIYLALASGGHLSVATARGEYARAGKSSPDSKALARENETKIELLTDPREGGEGAQAVYTARGRAWDLKAEGKC